MNKRTAGRSAALISCGLSAFLSSSAALADVHETYGVGATSTAMGNSQTACARGGSAAYFNAAALAKTRGMTIDTGFQAFTPNFESFENVVYDRNQNGQIDYAEDGTPETTTVGAKYPPAVGVGLNLAAPVGSRVGLGASLYIPSDYLMRIQYQDPYLPYYPLYKNRPQTFSAYVGLGIRIFDGLMVGVGSSVSTRISIDTRVTSNVVVNSGQTDPETGEALPTEVQSEVNLDELTVRVKGTAAPTVGVLMNFGWLAESLKGLNLGASIRTATRMTTEANVSTSAYGTVSIADDKIYSGPFTSEPVVVSQGLSSVTNPGQMAAGLAYTFQDKLTISADAAMTRWSEYQESFISVANHVTVEGVADVDVQVGRDVSYRDSEQTDPGLVWHDTITPRVGFEFTTPMPLGGEGFKVSVRGGYGYSPSPLPEQTWRTNLLDSNKHMISGGLGFQVPTGKLKNPLRVDMFASYHKLVDRIHTKEADLVDYYGEYPVGYTVGGTVHSGGSILGIGGSVGLTF